METQEKTQSNLILWKEGDPSPNPSGRPKGQRNYQTIYREAIRKIGEARDMTPEQVEELMEQVGLDKALEGDFKFFEDIRSRIHGKPKQSVQVGGDPDNPIVHQVIWD